jgi:phosphonate transport system substrate-binding protein
VEGASSSETGRNGAEGNTEEEAVPGEGEEFRIGLIPALTEGDYKEPIEKLEVVLDEALPQDVSIEVFPDYNAVVESLNFGHIEMAYLGPSTYVEANERSGARAIITQLIDGEPYYHSYIITHVEKPWDNLDELAGDAGEVRFAFGDINSTSGSLVPRVELMDRDLYADENNHAFADIQFLGSHDATGQAVQGQHVDAGAIDSAYFNTLIDQGKLDGAQFKILWESEPLYQYPWTVSTEVDDETVQLLTDAFLAIEDETILRGFGADGFVETSDEHYDEVRRVMQETGKLD